MMDKELANLYKTDPDTWYERCCKHSKWTIDYSDVVCTRCGRVLTDKIETIILA